MGFLFFLKFRRFIINKRVTIKNGKTWYLNQHEQNITCKFTAKKFVMKLGTQDDLLELLKLLKERINELK